MSRAAGLTAALMPGSRSGVLNNPVTSCAPARPQGAVCDPPWPPDRRRDAPSRKEGVLTEPVRIPDSSRGHDAFGATAD